MRFLNALGIFAGVGIVIGTITACFLGTTPSEWAFYITSVSVVTLLNGLVGAGIHRFVRLLLKNSNMTTPLGSITGFTLTPIISAIAIAIPTMNSNDGVLYSMMTFLLYMALPAAVIGAIFGSGVGQK